MKPVPSVIALAFILALPAAADPQNPPEFKEQTLVLTDMPVSTGAAIDLFDGKDLDNWDGWLGYGVPAQTYSPIHDKPMGSGGKGTMFKAVSEDGEPALYVNGKFWGSLVEAGDYRNYHLRLQYKWGKTRYAPRLDQAQNNGLLYHTHGKPGAVWGTWSRAVEFEIMTGSVGMVVPVGKDLKVTTTLAHDASLIDPKVRFMAGGQVGGAGGNTAQWNVENNRNADLPIGQWNTLDLYVVGNHAIHVVNGVPVMEVWDICDTPDTADTGRPGVCEPLTHGHIQLQSEGAETYFRHITLEPIDHLPVIQVVP